MPHYYINNNFRKARSINCNFDWLIMYHLYKPVHNDKDRVADFVFPICRDW